MHPDNTPRLTSVNHEIGIADMYAVQHQFSSNVVPRRQWNANWGYCGETSYICAGLSFGQYCSQYTARALASPGVNQSEQKSQLLPGVNDLTAASAMQLRRHEFDSKASAAEFMAWAKMHLLEGHVPIIGVFNNVFALGEKTYQGDARQRQKDRWKGDPQFDHIVPVLGFASDWPLVKDAGHYRYHASDVITFSDNGLYGKVGDPEHYPFLFSYNVTTFQGTRFQANDPRKFPIYMLPNKPPYYGVAIEGVRDKDNVTIPVSLSCDQNDEPEMMNGSNTPPTPVPIQLTATLNLPDQSVAYNLYRYDDFANVPGKDFNLAAAASTVAYHIPAGSDPITVDPPSADTVVRSGSTVVVTHQTTSDQTVVFRAVPASAS
ncbi:MAG TPA: hypothetical protein VF006_29045 [Longimicrobium sp.]